MEFKYLDQIIEELIERGIPETTQTDIEWEEFDKYLEDRYKTDKADIKNI